MKLGSDHSNESGIRDGGEEVSHEVAASVEIFWKAWYLNLLSIDELHSTYSAPQSLPECSCPASISVLVTIRLSLLLKMTALLPLVALA